MRAALVALPGVRHVDLDFEKKQAVATVASTLDSQKLVTALEEAGFGGSVDNVRNVTVTAETEGNDEPDEPADSAPLPGLTADEQQPVVDETTYSSPSFAEHVQISAYLDRDVLRGGDLFRIAVVLDIDHDWHIYGNPLGPGIGKETIVSVQREDGFHFEPARYSAGHRAEQDFGEAGKTWVWEHTGRTVHFVSGKVNDDLSPGDYSLQIGTSLQVCRKEACLPGKAKLPVSVTVVAGDVVSKPANGEFFKTFAQTHQP